MEKVSIKNTEHYIWGEVCEGWHLVNTEELSVIQEKVPAGGKEVLHYHKKANQFFFVLSGAAILEVNGEPIKLRKHNGCFIKSGVPHQLRNESKKDLIFLVISQPKSHGDRVVS